MIGLPAGTRIWLAAGVTDMRSGFNGLASKVQTALEEDPYSGHVFVFRGRRGDLIKVLWWTGDGLCLLCINRVDDFLPRNCAAKLAGSTPLPSGVANIIPLSI